jgi:hypothetical protein
MMAIKSAFAIGKVPAEECFSQYKKASFQAFTGRTPQNDGIENQKLFKQNPTVR